MAASTGFDEERTTGENAVVWQIEGGSSQDVSRMQKKKRKQKKKKLKASAADPTEAVTLTATPSLITSTNGARERSPFKGNM